MGRLDEIVARNQKALRQRGPLGHVIDDLRDPTQPPHERRRKLLAWGIVLVFVGAVALTLVLLLRPDGRAPGGKVRNRQGELIELSTLWRDRRVVVMFYAGYGRSRDQLSQLDTFRREIDATVIGISFGSTSQADRIHKELELGFELYTDPTFNVMASWDVPFVMADVTAEATFIVEPGGEISYKKIGQHPPLYDLVEATRR
jgi:peroxiredoxin